MRRLLRVTARKAVNQNWQRQGIVSGQVQWSADHNMHSVQRPPRVFRSL